MGALQRILVVDPHMATRESIRGVAKRIGAEVVEAEDGEQALLSFTKAPADVVIMASQIDRLEASELTAILKGKAGRRGMLPVLLMVGSEEAKRKFLPFESGADDYVRKPIDPSELEARLTLFGRVLDLEREAERTMREIERLVTLDEATGAYGRRFILGQVRHEWTRADRYGEALSLVQIELCSARDLREKLGAAALEILMRDMAHRLAGSLRRCDLVARLSWDQFLVVMPNTSTVGAYFAAEKIRGVVSEKPYDLGGEPMAAPVAIGVSTYQDGNFGGAEDLLDSAEEALRQARAKGPGSVVMFHPVAVA